MLVALILGSFIVIVCIAASQPLKRFGVPSLIMFLALGMLAGWAGPWGPVNFADFHIYNYHVAEAICSVALVFIIFYGGFGTNWKTARPVVFESVVYSTAGVLITAGIVMLFVHFAFQLSWAESFLIGSVLSCIDAASIFSILRSEKLSLRYNTASVLEIEGGCNDLPAYMLTVVALIILHGESMDSVLLTVVLQLVVGGLAGVGIAVATVWVLKKVGHRLPEGMNLLLIIAVSVLSYALSTYFGGNGYLSCYLCGIILGNSKIPNRSHIVTLFDSIDWLTQILIFFLLGLLVTPEKLPAMIVPGLALAAFLIIVARPAATFAIFPLFHVYGVRNNWRKCLFISWAGIRGAASIVFVFLALASGVRLESDLFSTVFIVALVSIAVQGTFFPQVARRLDMIDDESDYQLSFNDFQEQSEHAFIRMLVDAGSPWAGMAIREIPLGTNLLIAFIKRGTSSLVPKGDTVIMPGDVVVLSGEQFAGDANTQISRLEIGDEDDWVGHQISDLDLPDQTLIVSVVRRDGEVVVPKGNVHIYPGDDVTLFNWE